MLLFVYAFLFSVTGLIIYRLHFHPLSKFPGPKLAAVTSLYEFYFDGIIGGRYLWEVEKMHEKYGPIVRVNPHELHISDPEFYTEIYASPSRRREKNPKLAAISGTPSSMVAAVDHGLHRSRRDILIGFFSKKSISNIETMMKSKIEKLVKRLSIAHKTNTVIRLDGASAALTADIVAEYAYGANMGYLDHPNFKNEVSDAVKSLGSLMHILKLFPFLMEISKVIPDALVAKLSPDTGRVLRLQKQIREQVFTSLKVKDNSSGPYTMFDALSDASVPLEERNINRLQDEAFFLFGAGTETTAKAFDTIMLHLLSNKALLATLRRELEQFPSNTWAELEKLPYMKGVINEGLRLTGIIMRSTRRAPDEVLRYKQWTIPLNTLMSTSSYAVHHNSDLFPNPKVFDPERWIRAEATGKRLELMLVAFSKGSRQCLASHMALAELYLGVSTLVKRFDFDLYGVTPEDFATYRDYGFGAPKEKGKQFKVLVTQIRTP